MIFKKTWSFILSFAIVISCFTTVSSNSTEHWAENEINLLLAEGVIQGRDDGIMPDAEITRAELIRVINCMFGYTRMSDNRFNDVPEEQWYFQDMHIALATGYLSGDGFGYANPEGILTREEICVIFARLLMLDTMEVLTGFSDAQSISDWALTFVAAMKAAGLIQGYSDGEIKPRQAVTRAEAFTLAVRAREYKHQKAPEMTLPQNHSAPSIALASVGGGSSYSSGGTVVTKTAEIPIIREINPDSYNMVWTIAANASGYSVKLIRKTNGLNTEKDIYVSGGGTQSVELYAHLLEITALDRKKTEDFSVNVKALGQSGYADSAYSPQGEIFSAVFTVPLEPPVYKRVSMTGPVITLELSGAATTVKYKAEVFLNGESKGIFESLSGGDAGEIDISAAISVIGDYQLKITAIGDGEEYYDSEVAEYTYSYTGKILDPIRLSETVTWDAGVSDDDEAYIFTWENSPSYDENDLKEYGIEIKQGGAVVRTLSVMSNSFALKEEDGVLFGGDITVAVRAVSKTLAELDSPPSERTVNTDFAGVNQEGISLIGSGRQLRNITSTGTYIIIDDIMITNSLNSFSGTIIGNKDGGAPIVNLSMSSTDSVGMITTLTGRIENLIFEGTVSGGGNTGAVAGTLSGGSIVGCVNRAAVTAAGFDQVGGIVGNMTGAAAKIENCINEAAISGKGSIGGIVGKLAGGIIAGCKNYGSIVGTGTNLGGIAGYPSSGTTIQYCANLADISNPLRASVGGIAGASYGKTIECYNTGNITGNYNVGGIVGSAASGGISNYDYYIENCYNTGDVAGGSVSAAVGGIVGIIGTSSTGDTTPRPVVTSCYNIGRVNNGNGYLIANYYGVPKNITSNYYLDSITGKNIPEYTGGVAGASATVDIPLADSQMQVLSSFDFDPDVWEIVTTGNYLYPQLSNNIHEDGGLL